MNSNNYGDYAETYRGLTDDIDDSDSPICQHIQFYQDRNLPCLDSLILFVRHSLDNLAALRVCGILESYIVRRMLCCGNQVGDYIRINEDSYARIKHFFSEAIEKNGLDTGDIRRFAEFLF